jgi:hypothetical protein
MEQPTPQDIAAKLLARHPGTRAVTTWGETAIFLNPDSLLPKGVYVATLKDHDGAHDRASGLDRPGVFRLSFAIARPAFAARFGLPPPRPAKGGVVAGGWDFRALDRIMPHPVYAWMGWVAVLSPSWRTLDEALALLDPAVDAARQAYRRRLPRPGPAHPLPSGPPSA